jgi:hypothetical protein
VIGVSEPRYRCTSCGNLTRFDVTRTTRSRSFHHYTTGGDLAIEEYEVLDDVIENVECRWCAAAGIVEELTTDQET